MSLRNVTHRLKSKRPVDAKLQAQLRELVAAEGLPTAVSVLRTSVHTLENAMAGMPLTTRGRAAIEKHFR